MAPSQTTNGLLHPLNRGRLHLTNRGLSHPTNHRRLSSMNRDRLHRVVMSAAVPRPCITSPSTHYRNKATKRRLQPALCPRCPCGTDDAVSNQRTPPVGARRELGLKYRSQRLRTKKPLAWARAKLIERLDAPTNFERIQAYSGYFPRKPKWMMETSYRGRRKTRSGFCSLMCLAPVGPP